MNGKLLLGALLLLPLLLMAGLMAFAPTAGVEVEADQPLEVREDVAIAACDAPFNIYYEYSAGAEMNCEVQDGRHVMVVRTPVPVGDSRARLREKGAVWSFRPHHSRRFAGQMVRVEISGSCDGCDGNAKAIYATGSRGNSGWQVVDLQPERQVFAFEYSVPAIGDGDDGPGPSIILNSGAPEAVMYIDRIMITGAGE
ncbi:MAG: hypothetical protein RLN72_13100 [Henriciella sp.]